MKFQLEHVAIYCKDIGEAVRYYEKFFGGQATPIRKGSAGYGFCFVRIAGSPSIQLMESPDQTGVHHYGYVGDDVAEIAREFEAKGAEIVRKNSDAEGRLTTIFVKDPNGLEIEIRSPR